MPTAGGRSIIERLDAVEAMPEALCFLGLGQVGVGIKGPGGVIYVDPYLTDYGGGEGRLERGFPPPVEPRDVTNASHVLVTHAHADHFDPETLGPLAAASPGARFHGPHTCDFAGAAGIDAGRASLARVGEPFSAGGARVTPVPSAHTELEWSAQGYPYLGYVIEWDGVTVYHAGDTVVYDGLIETLGSSGWRINVMLVPINGRDYFRTAQNIVGNADSREAVELAEILDVGLVIPTHYDLFAFNAANPGHFVDHLYRRNPMRRHKLLRPGELYLHLKA